MVFRWLFGSSDKKAQQSSASPAARSRPTSQTTETESDDFNINSNNTPNTSTGPVREEAVLGPGDSTPNALEDLSGPLKVPLNAIPSFMIEDRPELKLSEYDMSRGQYARNVLALTHNAVRLEMADMWGDILPSLQSRCDIISDSQLQQKDEQAAEPKVDQVVNGNKMKKELTQSDADDVRKWWSGFARFALTASLVDDFICKKAFDDIYVGFDKELKVMEKQHKKVEEKNNVYLELAVKKMAKSVDDFEKDFSSKGFTLLVKSWQSLATLLADIYMESETLIENIDRWVREPFQYKDLEKQAAKIFTNKKRWGDDDVKRGEMIIILCRWVGTEDLMREWMYRNLTKKELRGIDKWMDDYRDKRLAIIDRFHQKKV